MFRFRISPKNVLHFSQLNKPLQDLLDKQSNIEMVTLWVPGKISRLIAVSKRRVDGGLLLHHKSKRVTGLVERIRFKAFCTSSGLEFYCESGDGFASVYSCVGSDVQSVVKIIQKYFEKVHGLETGKAVQYSLLQWVT